MTNTTKNILTGLVIVVILFTAYKFLVAKKEPPETSVKTSSTIEIDREESFAVREAASTLQRIKNIEIDTTVFSGDVFKSLKDYRVEVLPVPVGRDNPFAPIN